MDWASSPVKGDPEWASGTNPVLGKAVGLPSASPGALGRLRSLGHLTPMLLNLGCWVAPRSYALGQAGQAFDAEGLLVGEVQRTGVMRVVTQTLWAAQCLHQPA